MSPIAGFEGIGMAVLGSVQAIVASVNSRTGILAMIGDECTSLRSGEMLDHRFVLVGTCSVGAALVGDHFGVDV